MEALVGLVVSLLGSVLAFEYQRWRGRPSEASAPSPSRRSGPPQSHSAPGQPVVTSPERQRDPKVIGGVAGAFGGGLGAVAYMLLSLGSDNQDVGLLLIVVAVWTVTAAIVGTNVGGAWGSYTESRQRR